MCCGRWPQQATLSLDLKNSINVDNYSIMKNGLSFFLLVLCLCNIAIAQDPNRPGWLDNKPKAGNSSYVYVVERGGGRTVNEAVNNALLKVMRTTMMRIGAVVSWDEVNSAIQKGDDWGTVAMRYNIPINKVCEYVEQKTDRGYRVAVLCQVAKSGAVYPEFDDFTACRDTKSYNDVESAMKSALLPGLGQISKNHISEGYITMGGEAVLLSGGAIFYLIGKGKVSAMQGAATEYPYGYYRYANQYSTLRTLNITFFSAAAVLYVFNIYRAYSMTPRYRMDHVLLEPTMIQMDQSYAIGLCFTLNF